MVVVLYAALALVIAAALAWATWRLARWARGERPAAPSLGAPAIMRRAARPGVVLVHGICGFDRLALGPARVDYFRGVGARLDAAGLDPIVARLSPLAGIPERAAQLARLLESLPHDRVVVVAHSMGGLDARWALCREGVAPRVASLITIGTPHRGTPIADLLTRGPLGGARASLARFGLASEALDWLTTWRLAELNPALPDVDGVRYASVVAATADRARVHRLLRAPHAYLARIAGPSDGLVPASSQPWGEVLVEAEIDHWAQVGWSGGHDAARLLLDALDRTGALPPGGVPGRRRLSEPAAVRARMLAS
jgi:triacylglycerol lipase